MTLIEKLEALKEQIYYVDGEPNLEPFADKVNTKLDEAISIVRAHEDWKCITETNDTCTQYTRKGGK